MSLASITACELPPSHLVLRFVTGAQEIDDPQHTAAGVQD